MLSSFSILFGASLLSLLLHRTKWLKPFAQLSLLLALVVLYSGASLSLHGFAMTSGVQLFVSVLLIVLIAAVTHETDELTITQTLFLGTASIALLQSHVLLAFIVSFEAVSIISMVLVSHIRTAEQAEGAVKMFIAGAIATGILLLGTLFYVMGGGALLEPIDMQLSGISFTGVLIMLLGILYKLTIVPMHGWAVDTYALVRHSHAALLTGVAKSVVAVAAFKIFAPSLSGYLSFSVPLLVTLALITMTLGNFLALFEQRISRILAYSSIAQAGYMLLAFAAVKSDYAATGLLYMTIAYLFMQTAVFFLLDTLRKKYAIEKLEDLKGLAKGNSLLAFFFTVQLFSLAGIPLLAGFLGKAFVFYAGVDAGLWIAVLVALLNSALSVGYYAWIVKQLYFDEAAVEHETFNEGNPIVAQSILLAGTLYFGIFASIVFVAGKSL